jgi:hypothetical protein
MREGHESRADDRDPPPESPEFRGWYDHTDTGQGRRRPWDGQADGQTDEDQARFLGAAALRGWDGTASDRGEWAPDQIRELDVAALRALPTRHETVAEPRMAWVPVDGDFIQPTADVHGEPFKDGSDPARYATDLAALQADKAAHQTVDTVDPRHVGDYRIRLTEDPTTGVLTVTDGRHRIEAARSSGVPQVLAEVTVLRSEPVRDPAARGWWETSGSVASDGTDFPLPTDALRRTKESDDD